MRLNPDTETLHFSNDEQHISGLLPTAPKNTAINCFEQAYRAFDFCKRYSAQQGNEYAGTGIRSPRMRLITERLEKLDSLVYQIGLAAAPAMVEEFIDSFYTEGSDKEAAGLVGQR